MRKRVALTAAVLIGSAWPAQGYGGEDNEACASVQALPKTRIDVCTRLVLSEKWTGSDLAAIFHNRGRAYYNQGRFDWAIRDYDLAVDLAPDNAGLFNDRGNAYDDKGQYERAILSYDQAIILDPAFALAYINRGWAYKKLGQGEWALRDYRKAHALGNRLQWLLGRLRQSGALP